jgi:DNA-binding NtrC family response regulator
MFHAGDTTRAATLIDRENNAGSPPQVRSRCELISGLIKRRQGDLSSAEVHFKSALHFAREAGDSDQVAWAALHSFRTRAETQPHDSLHKALRDVRREVNIAADPHITIYMHDSIALMESSLGRPTEARRHLRICHSLLERNPNAWLEQLVCLNSSFVDFVESKYEDGLRHLKKAKALLPLTGNRQRAIIECNEGHALLGLGKFSAAIDRFKSLVAGDAGLPVLAALDGLARSYLAADDLDRCSEALEKLYGFVELDPNLSSAFAARWTSITNAKLLLRRGLYERAESAIAQDFARASTSEDKLLGVMLKCLRVEALAGSNQPEQASKLLATLALVKMPITPDQYAMYYRAVGMSLLLGDHPLANAALVRADAIWQQAGNRCASAELAHRVRAVRRSKSIPSRSEKYLSAISGLSAIFGFASNPLLVGDELKRVLESTDFENVALSESPLTTDQAAEEHAHLAVGEDSVKRFTISCALPKDPLKALVLGDVFRIARAAMALERFKEEERNRAALWPADPVETEAGALFLSEEMQDVLSTARRAAAANIPILITGETGTGKEVLARLIHAYSPRSRATFMPFNCTATPREMLDSQLFGHRRGAFTGATDNFQGVIRAAAGGTLFLDEIGEMTLDVQPKLLRFLESSEVHPIGESHPVRVDVRVIAATNANVDALVAQGRFREDLLYRLNTISLPLPPLRERRVEIPALASHYLRKYAAENHKGDLRLAEDTMEYLVLYRWPGNIRQLANEMRRMAALAEKGAVLMPEHLSPELAASRRTLPPSQRPIDNNEIVVRLDQPVPAGVSYLEQQMIAYAMKKCGGRLEETASMLGLSRKGLYLKRMRYGLETSGEPPPLSPV